MPKKNIYLDHASTTPVDQAVLRAMEPYWSKNFGNASSLYRLGLKSKEALEASRRLVAKILNCQPEEIIFTGSGTASINLALKGLLVNKKRSHLITSTIEHQAVLQTAHYLKNYGQGVTLVPVDAEGLLSLPALKKAIKKNTVLVSIMMANNEIGTLQPIQAIGNYLQKLNKIRQKQKLPHIYFHTDACQAAGAINLNVRQLHVDLLTINGSKIYGPKGTGLLYVKKGTPLEPLLHGGGQENNLMSGTENIPGFVGLAKALELVQKNRVKESRRLSLLRDWLIKKILTTIPKAKLNGHPQKRLPNNINISFLDIEGEAILLYLDEVGIQASTGSACTAHDLEPSHVIRALGCPYEVAHGSIRFTLGKNTTKKDLIYLISKLPGIVKKLRQTSPLNIKMSQVDRAIAQAPRQITNL
jgi:cysteine desulfurase